MHSSRTGTTQPSWKWKLLTIFQFVNLNWKRKFWDNASQPLDYIASSRRSVNIERLRSPRVGHHEEYPWQPRHMIRVHMCQANSSKLAESPTKRFPGYLCSLPTIH